ncbi:hypothetical protein FB451DRAFT_1434801 [Mycena latifolia]|nr:hypothetical protein FB451DRAFT_1434801 [Mycena latifolia]
MCELQRVPAGCDAVLFVHRVGAKMHSITLTASFEKTRKTGRATASHGKFRRASNVAHSDNMFGRPVPDARITQPRGTGAYHTTVGRRRKTYPELFETRNVLGGILPGSGNTVLKQPEKAGREIKMLFLARPFAMIRSESVARRVCGSVEGPVRGDSGRRVITSMLGVREHKDGMRGLNPNLDWTWYTPPSLTTKLVEVERGERQLELSGIELDPRVDTPAVLSQIRGAPGPASTARRN